MHGETVKFTKTAVTSTQRDKTAFQDEFLANRIYLHRWCGDFSCALTTAYNISALSL